MTRKWTRSPRGPIYGVVTGFAEWRDLPAAPTRLLAVLLILCTSLFPGLICYLVLAIILPMQRPEDVISDYDPSYSRKERKAHRTRFEDAEDAKWEERSTEDIRKEYEELKKKVETMESEMFDKEKDWDERFRSSEDR